MHKLTVSGHERALGAWVLLGKFLELLKPQG
jgi:hypothetical protein